MCGERCSAGIENAMWLMGLKCCNVVVTMCLSKLSSSHDISWSSLGSAATDSNESERADNGGGDTRPSIAALAESCVDAVVIVVGSPAFVSASIGGSDCTIGISLSCMDPLGPLTTTFASTGPISSTCAFFVFLNLLHRSFGSVARSRNFPMIARMYPPADYTGTHVVCTTRCSRAVCATQCDVM